MSDGQHNHQSIISLKIKMLKIERKYIFYLLSLLVMKKITRIPFGNLSPCDYTLLLSFFLCPELLIKVLCKI